MAVRSDVHILVVGRDATSVRVDDVEVNGNDCRAPCSYLWRHFVLVKVRLGRNDVLYAGCGTTSAATSCSSVKEGSGGDSECSNREFQGKHNTQEEIRVHDELGAAGDGLDTRKGLVSKVTWRPSCSVLPLLHGFIAGSENRCPAKERCTRPSCAAHGPKQTSRKFSHLHMTRISI